MKIGDSIRENTTKPDPLSMTLTNYRALKAEKTSSNHFLTTFFPTSSRVPSTLRHRSRDAQARPAGLSSISFSDAPASASLLAPDRPQNLPTRPRQIDPSLPLLQTQTDLFNKRLLFPRTGPLELSSNPKNLTKIPLFLRHKEPKTRSSSNLANLKRFFDTPAYRV